MSAYRLGRGMELDSGAFIVDMETFGLVGELEIRKALRLQYPVAIMVIRPGPSFEADARRLLQRISELVRLLVRQSDLVAVSSMRPPALYVLLVDTLPGDLDAIMARISREVGHHRLAGPGEGEPGEVTLGAACFPSSATTWRELLRRADRAATADA